MACSRDVVHYQGCYRERNISALRQKIGIRVKCLINMISVQNGFQKAPKYRFCLQSQGIRGCEANCAWIAEAEGGCDRGTKRKKTASPPKKPV